MATFEKSRSGKIDAHPRTALIPGSECIDSVLARDKGARLTENVLNMSERQVNRASWSGPLKWHHLFIVV